MHGMLKVVYSEIRGLHQSAYILAGFSLASQMLALLRDRLFAHTFGASGELDIYYAAFKIPDVLFVLFASMLSVYVLIPFISERLEHGDSAEARRMLSSVLSFFVWIYVICAGIVWIFVEPVSAFLFPGFEGVEQTQLALLIRILLLQPLLLGISSMCGVVTQLGQRFILYAISPLLYNLGIILGIWLLYPLMGLPGVVWGVVLGALLHLLIQVPFVSASDIAPRLTGAIDTHSLRRVLLNSIPRALTLSLNQLVLLGFAGIASVMAAGSVSIFQFAFNLQSVPLVIIGVSYSVAAFPLLAQLYSKGAHAEYLERVIATVRHILFWMIPAIVLIIVLRAQLVRVILGSGAFDWNDTRLTAAALALFSFSLAAQAVSLLMVRAFYAGGNTRTPFFITMATSVATLAAGLSLYVWFLASPAFASFAEGFLRVQGTQGGEILMLALGYSLMQSVHAAWLLLAFTRLQGLRLRTLSGTFVRSLIAGLGGGLIAYITLYAVSLALNTEKLFGIFLQGVLAGVAGLSFVAFLLFLMQSPELHELWTSIHRRLTLIRVPTTDKVDTLGL